MVNCSADRCYLQRHCQHKLAVEPGPDLSDRAFTQVDGGPHEAPPRVPEQSAISIEERYLRRRELHVPCRERQHRRESSACGRPPPPLASSLLVARLAASLPIALAVILDQRLSQSHYRRVATVKPAPLQRLGCTRSPRMAKRSAARNLVRVIQKGRGQLHSKRKKSLCACRACIARVRIDTIGLLARLTPVAKYGRCARQTYRRPTRTRPHTHVGPFDPLPCAGTDDAVRTSRL